MRVMHETRELPEDEVSGLLDGDGRDACVDDGDERVR